jgi:predicted dehydrogenase
MSRTPIRIGIIGAGGIVKQRHLPGFAKVEDCQVLAVHNRRRANAEAVAKEWKIPHVVDSPEAVYGRSDINAVLIGTTPYLHKELSIAALNAGKHVFCQARMARTMAEAREMAECALRHPALVTMICPPPHVMPGETFVQQLLDAGELGELRLVRMQHMTDGWLSASAPMHWRSSRDLSGYNVMTLGIYNEILNRWVGRARTVAAQGRIFTNRRKNNETGKMEDVLIPESVGITGELANGAHYAYTFSAVAPFASGDSIEIYGTRGALFYNVATHEIRIGKVGQDKQAAPVTVPADVKGEWRVEADFATAIREGKAVSPDFKEGVAYMEFVEAVGLSIEESRIIRLPLP